MSLKAADDPEAPDTFHAPISNADLEQEFERLLDFNSETPAPIEFAEATPVSEPGRKVLVFRDSPRALERHRMDAAPVNAKIVVMEVGAVFASPAGNTVVIPDTIGQTDTGETRVVVGGTFDRGVTGRLADGDIAHTLPRGTKVTKLGEQRFRAIVPMAIGDVEFTNSRFGMLVAEITHKVHDRVAAA